jgi:hypothetical protein
LQKVIELVRLVGEEGGSFYTIPVKDNGVSYSAAHLQRIGQEVKKALGSDASTNSPKAG